jgi:hypothetical protein
MMSPAFRYQTYLLALGLPDDEVNHLLAKDGFPVMEPDQMARARFELDLPAGFDPFDPAHEASVTWVRVHGLSKVFQGAEAAVEAFRLLRSPARLPVEMLLLAGMSAESISDFLNQHKAGKWSEAAIGRFASMFFAITEIAADDLVEYSRVASNGDAYRELMGKSADEVVTLAERLLQKTATWPWARRAKTGDSGTAIAESV